MKSPHIAALVFLALSPSVHAFSNDGCYELIDSRYLHSSGAIERICINRIGNEDLQGYVLANVALELDHRTSWICYKDVTLWEGLRRPGGSHIDITFPRFRMSASCDSVNGSGSVEWIAKGSAPGYSYKVQDYRLLTTDTSSAAFQTAMAACK